MSKVIRTKDKPLTDKEERFCQEYAVSHNGKEAAIKAGYAPGDAKHEAWRLRNQNEHVRERIAQLEAEASDELGITKIDIRNDIQAILDDPESTRMQKLRAIKLKGQLIGAFTERIDHSVDISPEMIESMKRVLASE